VSSYETRGVAVYSRGILEPNGKFYNPAVHFYKFYAESMEDEHITFGTEIYIS
jgi:hypothetical protein